MKRFVHELRYSRKITHKNVIRIYDFLFIQGNYAISMEYFPSHTLGSEVVGERVTLHTSTPDATARALIGSTIPWKDLEVKSNDLEETFVKLVHKGKGEQA